MDENENNDEVDRLAALMVMLMTANGYEDAGWLPRGPDGRYHGGCETADGRPISVSIGWTE